MIASGELDEAEGALAEAREAADAAGDQEALALVLGDGDALLRQAAGDLVGALEALQDAAPILERFGAFQAPLVHHSGARVSLALGRVEAALDWLSRGEVAVAESSANFVTPALAATRAHLDALSLDATGSQEQRERALAGLGLPLGDFQASPVWADLAFASAEYGRWDDVEADATLGLEASSSTRFWERPRLLAAAALAAVERADTDRASELVHEADAYVRQRRMRIFLPLLGYVSAVVTRAAGDLVAAEREAAAAETGAIEMGMRILACDVAGLRAEVAETSGHGNPTEHRLRQASIGDDIVAGISDPRLADRLVLRLHASATARPGPTA